jgi:uncharacterized protein involved in outer membrane biogenesis
MMLDKAPGKKRLWIVFGGFAAALALAILALVLLVDINRYKPRLESAASEALGLKVRIRGEMKVEFFPPLGLSLADLEVRRDSEDVLRVERVRARLEILPLLWGQVRIRGLGFVRPVLPIQRTSAGPFDFERYLYRPLRNAREVLPGTFDRLEEISATGGKISYVSKDQAIRIDADGIDLAIHDVVFRGMFGDDPFRNVSFTGTAKVARAAIGNAEASVIDCGLKAKNGNYEIQTATLQAFGGTGEGSIWVNLEESIPMIQARYSLKGFRVEQLSAEFGRKRGVLNGTADLSANLFMKGEHPDEWARTATGDVSWTGNDLAGLDFDPDAILSASGEGKGISFARTASLLLPTPPFPAAAGDLTGRDILGKNGEGEGTVRALASTWTVKNGVFEAKDVAFATKRYRLALTGTIDLPGERFDDVTVALVDDRGCVLTGQTIRGPFRVYRVAEAPVSPKKAPPGQNPTGKSEETIPRKECEVFYAGSVTPPE